MRRFFAPPDQFDGNQVQLSPEETRHLRDVLRLHVGDEVLVFDGAGREFTASVIRIDRTNSRLGIDGEIEPTAPESHLDLTLAAAILKSDKFDLVVQKAVELGVTRLEPLLTKRSEARPRDTAKRLDRWRKIALEASKQSGRARLMEISEPVEFNDLLPTIDEREGPVWLFSERNGKPLPLDLETKSLTAIVGPEGGWDSMELEQASEKGVEIATLGGRILRAETAAVAIAAILQHRFGDLH